MRLCIHFRMFIYFTGEAGKKQVIDEEIFLMDTGDTGLIKLYTLISICSLDATCALVTFHTSCLHFVEGSGWGNSAPLPSTRLIRLRLNENIIIKLKQ